MPPTLTLCYCDLAFNKGRPVLAVCDKCEHDQLEVVLEKQGKVARERADHPALDSYRALADSYDRERDRADMHRLEHTA